MGRALVRQLAARGARVMAHVRPDSRQLNTWTVRVAALGATIDTTAWDEDAMTATLAELRPAAVFALLGTTRQRARAAAAAGQPDGYEHVDYGLTALLLRATRRAAAATDSAPRFVYLSALGAAAGSRNPYVAVRGRLEDELRASGLPASALTWTVARPSFVTGPDRTESRPVERIGATIADALLTIPGSLGARRLRDRLRSTTADELARALARLAADPRAAGAVVEGDGLRTERTERDAGEPVVATARYRSPATRDSRSAPVAVSCPRESHRIPRGRSVASHRSRCASPF